MSDFLFFFAQTLPDLPQLTSEMGSFFQDSLNWAISASGIYLGFCSLLALTVYFFK